MKPPFPSATRVWHNDTYPAISPSRAELSCVGKVIVITGGGSGIGRETALAFAAAGAKHVALLGRRIAKLEATRADLPEHIVCTIHAVNIVDEEALRDVARTIGKWDVLVLNAGFLCRPRPISEVAAQDWWQSFETNVKGTMITAQAFLPTASATRASIIGVASAFTVPASAFKGLSAYISSKAAQVKMLEFLADENPHIFIASLQPGMIETDIFLKGGGQASALPMDTVQLPAHSILWLASPEAAFLRGKTVWANWDVDELQARAPEIQAGQEMTVGALGWPYAPIS